MWVTAPYRSPSDSATGVTATDPTWLSFWTPDSCVFTAESGFFAAAQLRQRIVREEAAPPSL